LVSLVSGCGDFVSLAV